MCQCHPYMESIQTLQFVDRQLVLRVQFQVLSSVGDGVDVGLFHFYLFLYPSLFSLTQLGQHCYSL